MECVLPIDAQVGECPTWNKEEQLLYWVDIPAQLVHRFDPKTKKNESILLDMPVSSIAFCKNNQMIGTLSNGFYFIDWNSQSTKKITCPKEPSEHNRFNDGQCDAKGRFWAGTIHGEIWHTPSGNLYCLNPDLSLRLMDQELCCSNGIEWSPDNKTMYFVESFHYGIFAYDFDLEKGTISNKRLFAQIPEELGFPDGICADKNGNIWCAISGGSCLWLFNPEGKLIDELIVPVPRPTSCAFGGPALDTLYITTTRVPSDEQTLKEYPLSGSLFAHKVKIPAAPTYQFGA